MKPAKIIFGVLLLFGLLSLGGCYSEKQQYLKITNYYQKNVSGTGVPEDLICVDWNRKLFTNGTTTDNKGAIVPCLKYGTSLELKVNPGYSKITFIRASDGVKIETIRYIEIRDEEPYYHYFELYESGTTTRSID